MKVSVIIPAYNEEKYLAQTLISLQNQTIKPSEIIVVDNNSHDQTAAIAKSWGATVIQEKKQGMIHARNKGFNSAHADIIARCDADVILPPDWIERIIQNFTHHQIDALSGPVTYYDSALKYTSTLPSMTYLKSLGLLTGGHHYLVGPNMILTRDIWNQVKDSVELDDTKVHEDIDLSLRIIHVGGKIRNDPHLVVQTSSRRIIHKPDSFFLEYPLRMIKTFRLNRQ
jgi:glycosyltransferase involved in cell wall biosynthesis